jgi:uncharacterized protein (TIGR00369 family)
VEHYRKLERMYAVAPINAYFCPALLVEQGKATIEIEVREDFHHTAGAMHGAVYFKALDDATFFAANSLIDDVFVLTAHFEIEFLRPVVSGTIRAEATVTEQTGRRIHAKGELFDEKGNLVGRGRGEFARSKIRLSPDVQYI